MSAPTLGPQNTAWPDVLMSKITDACALRGVTVMYFMRDLKSTKVEDVHVFTSLYDLELTPEEMSLFEDKAIRPTPPEALPSPLSPKLRIPRAQFYAACWLCGAAYRQIGRMMDVSHQSVHASAGRVLGMKPQRVVLVDATDEQVAAFKREWANDYWRSVPELVVRFREILNEWRD